MCSGVFLHNSKMIRYSNSFFFKGVAKMKYSIIFSGIFGECKGSTISFLFSLRNKDNLPPFKCPIYDHENDRAIYCDACYGACFGSGRDLYIKDNSNTNRIYTATLVSHTDLHQDINLALHESKLCWRVVRTFNHQRLKFSAVKNS